MTRVLRGGVAAAAALALVLAAGARADCYMINPRGSNNRWRTTNNNNKDVQNNARLFDSQNNGAGGYDIAIETPDEGPAMQYIVGSHLVVQWGTQHGCGAESNAHCEVVLQYMCDDDEVRDGTSNQQVQFSETNPTQSDGRGVGMHENWYHYHACTRRSRNKGLFWADQKPDGESARYTRQSPNGDRNGLECPEERDYYPYWAPSPWKDIAVLTNDESRCEYYWANTQNTNPKHQCVDPDRPVRRGALEVERYLTERECTSTSAQRGSTEQRKPYRWQQVPPHFHDREAVVSGDAVPNAHRPFYDAGNPLVRAECVEFRRQAARGKLSAAEAEAKCRGVLGAPHCLANEWQRDNHIGAVRGGFLANYTWRVPDDVSSRCVLRVRYNISTTDYDGWATFADRNGGKRTGISPVEQDAYVQWKWLYPIELALDTTQFGRTFQDRSHTFEIVPRPRDINADFDIYNLNVRGKRGHVTQTYPLPTYDFVPRELRVPAGAYVHFQWEGASHWPTDFYGAGVPGTDRHNVVQIKSMRSEWPLAADDETTPRMFPSNAVAKRFAMVGQDERGPEACLSRDELHDNHNYRDTLPWDEKVKRLALVRQDQHNCAVLNQADKKFNHAPIQFNKRGSYYYMCTRNSRPGYQVQKGAIHVE